MLYWRECKGVEPSAHAEGRTPAELKSQSQFGGYRGQVTDTLQINDLLLSELTHRHPDLIQVFL